MLAHAGTLEDMDLRSNVEASIRGTAATASLQLKVRVEHGVAIPEGIVRDLNQADEVVDLAARVKGIVDVDRSGLRLEFAAEGDAALATAVARVLSELPQYNTTPPKVEAAQGVVTLTGNISKASLRRELRKICGGIEGVTGLVDRLESPETADERIQRALDRIFGARAIPRFPGTVRAAVAGGVVTLEGFAPRLYDKRRAEDDARAVNGVRRVDNKVELGSANAVKVIHP